MPLKIGLTGNIGCGKSTVARLLVGHGFESIDTDQIARDIMKPPSPVLENLVKTFGRDILSGENLNREALAAKVFGDPDALRKLNSLTHPAIGNNLMAQMAKATGPVVVGVPLLFEAKMEGFFDEIWVVTCPEEAQFARIMKRGGISQEEAKKRMDSQLPQKEKASRAHRVIPNNGSLEELKGEVAKVVRACLG